MTNAINDTQSTQESNLQERLGAILATVETPARYMGGEANSVVKPDSAVLASMVLAFPDLYEIGMSHNGTRILYHVINREADLLCDVAFAPWKDMAARLREESLPLYGHATFKPLHAFDVVGISLQTELNFTNVPYVLDLGGIPVWAHERQEKHPFVIGGGPSMANPEPVADFFDAFVIGDGELLAPRMLRMVGEMRQQGCTRAQILQAFAELSGVYVPQLMPVVPSAQGELVPQQRATGAYWHSPGVRRTWVEVLNPKDYPVRNLVANMPLVHDRFAIEVMRGCTQGCRFCQAGYWYRPNRELNPDAVVDLAKQGLQATGERQLGLLSLSSADYGPIEKLTDAIIDDPYFDNVDVSLPSLRANSFGQSLAQKVAALKGGRSATFAPETGSERIRRMINKTISDQEMYDAAESVFANGFTKIKLYTMVGMPTENLEDMEAFCGLIDRLAQIGRKHNKAAQVHANIGILIPKAFTPMQWCAFKDRETVMEHIYYVREAFRRHRNVRISWATWETSHLEAIYSRGDRRLAPLIHAAYQRGMVFESDSKCFDYQGWLGLFEEFGYDPSWVFQERDAETVFPWDFIHAGVTKGFLRNEYKKMFQPEAEPVPDCKWGACQHCGVPGNYQDIKLAPDPVVYKAPSRTPEEIATLVESRRPKADKSWHYELQFRKLGNSRFLPHQNTLSFFERSLARMAIPIKFSEGFSPKPRIHNTGALPLGLESLCERISIELLAPLDLENSKTQLLADISAPFPRGMEVTDIVPLDTKLSKRMPKAVEYQWKGVWPHAALSQAFQDKTLPIIENHRGIGVNLNEHILELRATDPNTLTFVAKANTQGNSVSPFTLLAGLLGLSDESTRQMTICKQRLLFDMDN